MLFVANAAGCRRVSVGLMKGILGDELERLSSVGFSGLVR